MKKVGLLGGSFDPIHNGHLHLALELSERHLLDEVWFIPARTSPFKQGDPPKTSGKERLEMVKRALSPLPRFHLLSREVEAEQELSYTIDTVRFLYRDAKALQLHLLLGEDLLPTLGAWKEVEELIRLAPPLVGSRGGITPKMPTLAPALLTAVQKGITQMPVLEVSSTTLRSRLAKGLFCGHLMPASVLDYIAAHGLYRSRGEL